ncbi:MAG: hypothetical protein R3E83_21085 [Burkholderiaceae bacterium]
MRTHKKSALFLATALLALSPSLASAKACKLKFTFKNEFPSLIKVAAMDTLYGSAENLRNKRLESGQSWTSSERSLGHATNARLVIEPGDRIRLTARFEVWDAANRTWRKHIQSSPERPCPTGKNIHFNLSPSKAEQRNW